MNLEDYIEQARLRELESRTQKATISIVADLMRGAVAVEMIRKHDKKTPEGRAAAYLHSAIDLEGISAAELEQLATTLSAVIETAGRHFPNEATIAKAPARNGRPPIPTTRIQAHKALIRLLIANYATCFKTWPSQDKNGRDFALIRDLAAIGGIINGFKGLYEGQLSSEKRHAKKLNQHFAFSLPTNHKLKKPI